MGFMDKVKVAVKSGAEQAATKAQAEDEKMQVRRELSEAFEALGAKAFDLADRGEISHSELGPVIEQVRVAKDKLDSIGKEPEAAAAASTAEHEPSADQPPPAT